MNKRITKKKKVIANNPSIVSSFDAKYNVLKKFEMNDPYLIETLETSINTSIFKKITVFISISEKNQELLYLMQVAIFYLMRLIKQLKKQDYILLSIITMWFGLKLMSR